MGRRSWLGRRWSWREQVETEVLPVEQPAREEPDGSHTHWRGRRSVERSPELSQVGSVVFSESGREMVPTECISQSWALTPKAMAVGSVSACSTLYTPTAWQQVWGVHWSITCQRIKIGWTDVELHSFISLLKINFVLVGNCQKPQSLYGLIAHRGLQGVFSPPPTVGQAVRFWHSLLGDGIRSHSVPQGSPAHPRFRRQLQIQVITHASDLLAGSFHDPFPELS